jgi:F-type H+/Na+-transporting ATPase subunit beta
MSTGTVAAVRGGVVDVVFDAACRRCTTCSWTAGDGAYRLEVMAQLDARTVRCVAATPVQGLARGDAVVDTGAPLQVPVGPRCSGACSTCSARRSTTAARSARRARRSILQPPPPLERQAVTTDVLETGIKAIDVLSPLERGGKAGLFGGAGVGKTVLITEMIHHMAAPPRREPVLRHRRALARGRGAHPRRARRRRRRAHRAGVRPDERAAGRALPRRAHRPDDGRVLPRRGAPGRADADRQRVPLRAGRRRGVGPDGRLSSRMGYQPTMATELAELQERITSTAGAAITAVQAVYVPADDFTDPAVVHAFGHLSASVVLSRDRAAQGLYPAIDPLRSNSSMLTPVAVGERHDRIAREVRQTLAVYDDLKDIIAMLGLEELSEDDQRTVGRARRLERYLTQPFYVDRAVHRPGGAGGRAGRRPRDCERILADELADVPEGRLYMIGSLAGAGL